MGGEIDSRYAVSKALHLRLLIGIAHTVSRSTGPGLIFAPEVENPLFPLYQFHLIGDYLLFAGKLRLSGEVSFIGPRPESFSNSLILGSAYSAPDYFYTALALSAPRLRISPNRDTSVTLRISNVLNTSWVEPGFGGVDLPAQGIVLFLTMVQAL
jgi:hypothetical protein